MAKRQRSKADRHAAILVSAMLAVTLVPAPAAATVYAIGDDGHIQVERSGAFAAYAADPTEYATAVSPDVAPDVPAAAITIPDEPSIPSDYRRPLLSASQRYDISPRLLAAVTRQESRWRASAVSPKGAIGLTQLMPATARALEVDPRDPSANLLGGARYLRQLLDQFDGNIERALAAYNAGPGRVARALGVPAIPETRAYVTSIVDNIGATALSQGSQ